MNFRLLASAFFLLPLVTTAAAQTPAPVASDTNCFRPGLRLLDAGKLDSAQLLLERSVAAFRMAPDNDTLQHKKLAHALQTIGGICQEHGQPDKALAAQLEALRIRREYLLIAETVHSYGAVSALMITQNRCEEALRYLEKGIAVAKATGNAYSLPSLMKFQGLAEFHLKHYDKVEPIMLAAIEEAKAQQTWYFAADICNSLAIATRENPTLSHRERKEKVQLYMQMSQAFGAKGK